MTDYARAGSQRCFFGADDVEGASEPEWRGATRMIHALLGPPADLAKHDVYHAYVDVAKVKDL